MVLFELKAAIKARKHFDHRMTLAGGFLTGAHELLTELLNSFLISDLEQS